MKALDIQRNHSIICYDKIGVNSAPRAAFLLRYFGAGDVRILNGGLSKWMKENRPTVSGKVDTPPTE